MWVVLLDGVGVLCVSAGGARGISRPSGRKGSVSRPRTSDCCRGGSDSRGRARSSGLSKAAEAAFTARLRRCTGIGLDGLVPVDRFHPHVSFTASETR